MAILVVSAWHQRSACKLALNRWSSLEMKNWLLVVYFRPLVTVYITTNQ